MFYLSNAELSKAFESSSSNVKTPIRNEARKSERALNNYRCRRRRDTSSSGWHWLIDLSLVEVFRSSEPFNHLLLTSTTIELCASYYVSPCAAHSNCATIYPIHYIHWPHNGTVPVPCGLTQIKLCRLYAARCWFNSRKMEQTTGGRCERAHRQVCARSHLEQTHKQRVKNTAPINDTPS